VIEHRTHTWGVVAEFEGEERFLEVVRKTREAGYREFEAYAPFPVEGLSEALGLKRNNVPLITLTGGCIGGLSGFFFQYWAMAITYPVNIGGRSLNSWPAWIPVTFEMTVLGAALAAVFGMLALNKLPQPHHPLFNVHRFAKHASSDRFFVAILARDPKFHLKDTARFLQQFHAAHVTEVEDD
jgi:Protein of unknown function (DUF3341)